MKTSSHPMRTALDSKSIMWHIILEAYLVAFNFRISEVHSVTFVMGWVGWGLQLFGEVETETRNAIQVRSKQANENKQPHEVSWLEKQKRSSSGVLDNGDTKNQEEEEEDEERGHQGKRKGHSQRYSKNAQCFAIRN